MRVTLLLLVCCVASLNFLKVAGSPTSDKELDFEGESQDVESKKVVNPPILPTKVVQEVQKIIKIIEYSILYRMGVENKKLDVHKKIMGEFELIKIKVEPEVKEIIKIIEECIRYLMGGEQEKFDLLKKVFMEFQALVENLN